MGLTFQQWAFVLSVLAFAVLLVLVVVRRRL